MISSIYRPGEKIENEFVKEKIRSKINEMLKWKRNGFPGSNPVSLTKHNIKNLFNKEYLICEKTDGVRYFLFIASNTTFLIDRNYEIFKNDMHIPTIEDLKIKQQLTLLDGELVEDTIFNIKKGIEQKKVVYLIYDALFIQRKDITNLSYLERLTNAYNYVITPLKLYKKKVQSNIVTSEDPVESLNDSLNVNKRKCISYTIKMNDKGESTLDINNSIHISTRHTKSSTQIHRESVHDDDDDSDNGSGGEHSNILCISDDQIHTRCDGGTSGSGANGMGSLEESSEQDTESTLDEWDCPFEIYLKDFYSITQICDLIQIAKKLPHTSDGIIFTPLHSPYITGNFYQLLKWKPLNLNTVDFGIETVYDENKLPNKFELFIAINGVRTSYKCYLAAYGDVYKELLELAMNNKISHYIIECYYVSKNIYSICKNDNSSEERIEGGWIAQKIRFDKSIPNDIKTLNKVIQSILDNITIDSLIKEIVRNRRAK
ncbi:mRNA-capping enzyme subunit alpha [Plasmodium brasilianum]|uniref:mRNA guanylyltransferase n=2 Tax=Plasmodium (Plasmodium) TaxID=418103 RepID=A0A1A8W9M2_PLAMA|nr:mRNA-capping enzyme subunit alpha, putative [Plasmodium malariae]KAI4835854.1 mRNA-capping enzyme subunit alpha [Plasmodium brasilianum]SBS89728.1 RNA guanylyltransferase, putative [Plasmodium malariae]SCP02791.1 mRNA-capping enzyme subunit alpha, putative [Plasmodium malariae]